MRLGNEADQEVMRKAISGSSRSAINFLPSLADREAIAFGRAVSTPMRMMFETLPQRVQPRSSSSIAKSETTDTSITLREVEQMIANMRGDKAAASLTNDAWQPETRPAAPPAQQGIRRTVPAPAAPETGRPSIRLRRDE